MAQRPGELRVGTIEDPPFGDRKHRFALLPDAIEVNHQIFERIERQLLPAARLHLLRYAGCLERVRIARVVQFFFLVVISTWETATASPQPLALEHLGDDRGLALEGDLGGRHLWRHHRNHVVGTEHAVDEVHQRLAHRGRAFDLRVIGVEEDHEDAGPWIARHLPALLDGVRLHSELLRDPGADPDTLESLDLLWHAVFEDLDFVLLNVLDGLAITRGVHVHADVRRTAAERRLALTVLRAERHRCERKHDEEGDSTHTNSQAGWLWEFNSRGVLRRAASEPRP